MAERTKHISAIRSYSVTNSNAPINVMPHYPLPGYRGEMVGHLTCFDTKNCPIHGEFDHQPYVCAISQIPHLFLDFLVGLRLGFDQLACPIGGAFELCKIQIPTYSPTLPGWGVVGHNIDRCISDESYISCHSAWL